MSIVSIIVLSKIPQIFKIAQILLNGVSFICWPQRLYTLVWGWFTVLKASIAKKIITIVSPKESLYAIDIRIFWSKICSNFGCGFIESFNFLISLLKPSVQSCTWKPNGHNLLLPSLCQTWFGPLLRYFHRFNLRVFLRETPSWSRTFNATLTASLLYCIPLPINLCGTFLYPWLYPFSSKYCWTSSNKFFHEIHFSHSQKTNINKVCNT